jgi:hypothetical protein
MNKAKNKKTSSLTEEAELLKQLYENFEHNRQAFEDFIQSNQQLSTLEKAEAWLNYVSENILDTSDQEAIIYLVSRGHDCSELIDSIITRWKLAATGTIKAALSAKYIYDVGTSKKKLSRKAITDFNKVSDFSIFALPDFWMGREGQEETIDATMLRTVEWCEIGGFDDWWVRLSQETRKNILHGGLEEVVPRGFWLFAMCRSDYAIELMKGSLEIALETIKIPEHQESFPWRITRFDFEDFERDKVKKIVVDVVAQASSIVFSHTRLYGNKKNDKIVADALEFIQKSQKPDGSWGFYSDGESNIETTAVALHALAVAKPRGWIHSVKMASNWLWTKQNSSGYWGDELYSESVFLSVLVLDAIELANNGTSITFGKTENENTKSVKSQKSNSKSYKYKVALSFPGEVREKVEEIAKGLARRIGKDKVFYDKFHEAELARPNLDVYLQSIYHDKSKLVVLFLCEDYEKKEWCGLEWRAIRDLIKKRSDESIMPLRLDNADISGLFSIDGYIDIRGRATTEIINLICSRIN